MKTLINKTISLILLLTISSIAQAACDKEKHIKEYKKQLNELMLRGEDTSKAVSLKVWVEKMCEIDQMSNEIAQMNEEVREMAGDMQRMADNAENMRMPKRKLISDTIIKGKKGNIVIVSPKFDLEPSRTLYIHAQTDLNAICNGYGFGRFVSYESVLFSQIDDEAKFKLGVYHNSYDIGLYTIHSQVPQVLTKLVCEEIR